MHVLDLEETLPLVYQLLLLSQKGYKGEILRGIIAYYQHLENQGQEDSVRERYLFCEDYLADLDPVAAKSQVPITSDAWQQARISCVP